MLFRLFLAFSLIPLVEIYLLVKAGSAIGAAPTIGIVLLTGFAGAWMARQQGLSVMARVRENLNKGVPPTGELVDALLIFVAGAVLLTPGFVTDAVGLALLVPAVRAGIRGTLQKKFESMAAQGSVHVVHGHNFRQGQGFGQGPGFGQGHEQNFGQHAGQDFDPFQARPRKTVKVINPEPSRGDGADQESIPGRDQD